MNYQNYEDYMRSVLGYSPYEEDNYTYSEQEDFVDNMRKSSCNKYKPSRFD